MPTARGADPAAEEYFLGALYRGGELLASGKIVEAREHLEKAHELEPKNEKAQNLLGLTYFKLGLFDLAAHVYEELVRENPADPTLRVNLGLVFLKTNDLERSIREFEAGTDLDPGHKKAHNYLGLALAQKGDYARAREHFLLAGSDQMAEKMERALEARGSVSSTGTRDVPMTPSPPSEPTERPMLPPPTPPGSSAPPPQRADHAEEVGPEATLEVPAAQPPESEVRAGLASDWGDHVPDPSSPVPEFTIEERTEAHGPDVLELAPGTSSPSFAMNDVPLVPVGGPLEPVDVRLEGLPAASETLPVLESSAVEVITLERAPSQPAEPSIWLTEHVADVPLTAGEPSPAPRRAWSSPSWVDAPDASAPPQWTPAAGEAAIGWMNEPSSPQDATPVSGWPTEEAPTGGAELGAWAPQDAPAQPISSFSESAVEPIGHDVAATEQGLAEQALSPEMLQGAAPPEPQQVDESNWVMQPVSEAFAAEPAPPGPAPSTGFVPMPTRRLAELGQTPPWVHESAAEPFQLGPEGLAVTVAGEMLVRMEGLVAVVGSLTISPEPRRRRGRPTAEPFGDGPAQLHRAMGHGVVYLEGAGGFHSLDLSDQPTSTIDDDGAYLREELVFAFEESVSFDNGRLTDENGMSIDLVHLKGHGKVLLRLDGGLRAMPIPPGTPTMVPLSRLVGWFGRATPRLIGLGTQGAVELTGDGFALLISPTP